ncbi:spondin domain-containing protein [Amphritea atlantica]|uniref:Spondin domain-containing protein n=1 Tax=Amphritea atlantica TaxID=355243 RepID=A0ABY5GW96_9GAMM|nr:spondin domain-containing protein [Amphritea atlantica]
MNVLFRTVISALFVAMLLSTPQAFADSNNEYAVTITNITRGQTFTPILVASHRNHAFSLFTAGEPASEALATLAEGGDTQPLMLLLEANKQVIDFTDSGSLLTPGESVTVTVAAGSGARNITLAAMLIPTNDSFIALQSVKAPGDGESVTYWSPAYDAGSEPNDELCSNIPGPVCGGEGVSAGVSGEGYVHISAGIQGIGDLLPELYDWRNPVAMITIKHKG